MTNNTNNSIVSTPVVIKLVEITGQRPLGANNRNGEQFIAGRGEARIYANRADRKGVALTREARPNELLDNLFEGNAGLVTLDPGSKNVEAPTHVAFVPVQPLIGEDYDAALHVSGIQSVLEQALALTLQTGIKTKPADITLRMTAPGTFEGREASEARKGELEGWLKERGVSVEWLTATADLPEGDRYQNTTPVSYGDFVCSEGDLFVNGSRRLRSARITEALRTVGSLLVKGQQAERLIVPMTIGANITLAEAAMQSGIPVVLAYIGSNPATWQPDTKARLNALTEAGASIIGDLTCEYADGLFSASIEAMAERVTKASGSVALLTEPNSRGEGKRLRELPGVTDFWPAVKGYLDEKLGAGTVDAALVDKQAVAAQAVAAVKANLEETIPF